MTAKKLGMAQWHFMPLGLKETSSKFNHFDLLRL